MNQPIIFNKNNPTEKYIITEKWEFNPNGITVFDMEVGGITDNGFYHFSEIENWKNLVKQDLKPKVVEAIQSQNLEKVLSLLHFMSDNGVLYQGRYNALKKQYTMGMIESSEYTRGIAQIGYDILKKF